MNVRKKVVQMKGIKLGIIAICIGLFGLSIGSNNFFAYCGGGIAVLLSIIAYFIDNNKE